MRDAVPSTVLVVEAGGTPAGIPLACVRETMRPLPIMALAGAPAFVLGVAVIRGSSVPVVDLGAVLGRDSAGPAYGRFVTLEVAGRPVALAVTSVRGVTELSPSALGSLPPLLSGAADVVETLAMHDRDLLVILRAGRLLPQGLPPESS